MTTSEFKVAVSAWKCENRQTCLEVCPTNVLEMVTPAGVGNPLLLLKIRIHGGLIAGASREADCIGCMACVDACPEHAIRVTRMG